MPATSELGEGLRRNDRDRFQTALFAPPAQRAALFALYAFNFEVARIREVVREPLLGQMRLQWWRDVVSEIYRAAPPRRHEIVTPLSEAIRDYGLSSAHFERLLDARAFDLSDDAPTTLTALETYAAESSGSLVLLALEALGVRDDEASAAGRDVGIAFALTGLLTAVPFHARARRLYLPQDLIAARGLDPQRSLFELKATAALAGIVAEVAQRAQNHLDAARRRRKAVPRDAVPALLPAVIAARRLLLLERVRFNVFDPRLAQLDPRQSWRLAWAAWRGRY